jgi:protease-4
MMRRNPWFVFLFIGFLFAAMIAVVMGASTLAIFEGDSPTAKIKNRNSLLVMDLKGIIFDSEKFLKKLKKYKDEPEIKGILLRINSPGGAVGPSEEIYRVLKQLKEKTKKPIVVYSPSLNASGGYYISMAADKIVVTKGCLIGSIGVIMEFANLEKLYDWAKVSRYTITSGKFKDSGSEYRSMKDEERQYFQNLVMETYSQFREAVKEGRKLDDAVLNQYADGRIFNGSQAVSLGFADAIGVQEDAVELLAELAGIKNDYELFEPPKKQPSVFERLIQGDDEDDGAYDSKLDIAQLGASHFSTKLAKILKVNLLNRPLFLMPGVWDPEDSE